MSWCKKTAGPVLRHVISSHSPPYLRCRQEKKIPNAIQDYMKPFFTSDCNSFTV